MYNIRDDTDMLFQGIRRLFTPWKMNDKCLLLYGSLAWAAVCYTTGWLLQDWYRPTLTPVLELVFSVLPLGLLRLTRPKSCLLEAFLISVLATIWASAAGRSGVLGAASGWWMIQRSLVNLGILLASWVVLAVTSPADGGDCARAYTICGGLLWVMFTGCMEGRAVLDVTTCWLAFTAVLFFSAPGRFAPKA
jgi:hypothetical protein